jgi:oxalate decarboxylase/phosphoglucose isomerase-like protein (cupin superfamily)
MSYIIIKEENTFDQNRIPSMKHPESSKKYRVDVTDMNENGGTLRFSYTIDFNNDLASENDLTVEVAVKNQEV